MGERFARAVTATIYQNLFGVILRVRWHETLLPRGYVVTELIDLAVVPLDSTSKCISTLYSYMFYDYYPFVSTSPRIYLPPDLSSALLPIPRFH